MARKCKNVHRRNAGTTASGIRFPTWIRLYADARARAMEDYPTILGIHECHPHVYRCPPRELLRSLGYERYPQRFWDYDKEDYAEHAQTKGNLSGHVMILADGQEDRPVVFIMRPKNTKDQNLACAQMMGILFHELGHVDDIACGLHLRMNTLVDITTAEEHAHRYACERIISETRYIESYMMEFAPGLPQSQQGEWRDGVMGFYRVIMARYIGEILPKYTELPQESVREAALRVMESDDMTKFRRFAGSALDQY